MKQLLLQTIACCAVLLPFTKAEAATYGGFKPGKTFTMTVKERISTQMVGQKLNKKAAVPTGLPDYKVGQKITFTIGPKGQLTAKNVNLPYKTGRAGVAEANSYLIPPSQSRPEGDSGLVFKTAANKPTNVSLFFARFKLQGYTGVTNVVSYALE